MILHYAISMPMWDGPILGGGGEEKTPKVNANKPHLTTARSQYY